MTEDPTVIKSNLFFRAMASSVSCAIDMLRYFKTTLLPDMSIELDPELYLGATEADQARAIVRVAIIGL